MREVTVIVPGIVVPKQSARFRSVAYYNKEKEKCDSFLQSYVKKEVTKYEELVKLSAAEQISIEDRGNLMVGALEAEVLIVYGIPKSMTKRDEEFIRQGGIIYKTTLPDLTDNLVKGLFDALEKVIYENDGQICSVSSTKIYGVVPRAVVRIKEINSHELKNQLV